MRIKNLSRIVIGTAVIGTAFFALTRTNHHTDAQTSTACQGFVLGVPSNVPMGNVPINLGAATAPALAIQDVVFKIDSAVLGRGVRVGTNQQWQMVWYTQYSPPGNHTIGAQIIFTDSSSCMVNPVPTTLTGTVMSGVQLTTGAMPSTFQGLTNQVINFGLKSAIGSTSSAMVDVSQYTYFNNKSATLGSITPLDGSQILRFSTGPAAGAGNIVVTASYGGISKAISIPVSIQAQTTTASPAPTSTTATTSPSTTPTTTSSTTPTTTTVSDSTTAAASTASIEAEKPLKDCVLSKLGAVRYQAISSGQSRPTAAEFESINQCFAGRNFVLPSGFVPVQPSLVKNQEQTKDVAVDKTENITQGSTIKLNFKGRAKPNTVVLLYVYSEPLVLSTTADKNGDWSYSLEDPLQPGDHEVYAVVDKGDGTYQRSSVFDFAIAKASASASNPNGYSLELSPIQATAKDSTKLNIIYIGGIGLLTMVMLGATVFGIVWRQRKKKKSADVISSPTTLQPVTPSLTSPATPAPTPVQEAVKVLERVMPQPVQPAEPLPVAQPPKVTTLPVGAPETSQPPQTGQSRES
jgi:hypothetical protein